MGFFENHVSFIRWESGKEELETGRTSITGTNTNTLSYFGVTNIMPSYMIKVL